jgi:uncharacterized protein YdaU (DUF1376 family)
MSASILMPLLLVGAAMAHRFGVVSSELRFIATDSLESARALGGVVQGAFDEDVLPTGWATLRVSEEKKKQKKQKKKKEKEKKN